MSDQAKWFSQTLLTFKDKAFNTDGYLRVAISTNTEDYRFFNPPLFSISINNANSYQKSANLNIQNVEDLLESFQKVFKHMNGDELTVEKHYNIKSKLFFKFSIHPSSQERVVVMEIYSNESDAVKVIVPIKPTFQSFMRRLKFFVENYDRLCTQLLMSTISYESTQIIQQLPGLIKGVSSQITQQEIIQDNRAPEPEPAKVTESETTNYDFEKFLGEDMENIKVPEIDTDFIEQKQEESIVEFDSPFVAKVLKNDLTNLESKLTSFAVSTNPVVDIAEDLATQLPVENLLNGITEDDMKSLVYLSKLLIEYDTKAYTISNRPVPTATPTLKFKGKKTDENVDLAKDILTLISFMKLFIMRMETKVENPYDSKTLMYVYMRYMLDAFCFSYLQEFTNSEIKSSVVNRYKYFDSIGVFDSYKAILHDNNCSPVEIVDIEGFADQVYNAIVKSPMIEDTHETMYQQGSVKLPSKHKFNLEQIINEFVLLEVNEKIGFDFKDKDAVQKLKDQGISDVIMKFFTGSKKVEKKSTMKKITPLQRVVEKFQQDIPEQYREDVMNHVKDLEYNKFDFSKCVWPLEEFDSRVVVALYVWDPDADSKMKSNFAHFMSLVESEQMTKDDIIIANSESSKTESFGFEDINFEM